MNWYIAIGALVFLVMTMAMMWGVCADAAREGEPILLVFIPLFAVGIAMVAVVWPLTLLGITTYLLLQRVSQ